MIGMLGSPAGRVRIVGSGDARDAEAARAPHLHPQAGFS